MNFPIHCPPYFSMPGNKSKFSSKYIKHSWSYFPYLSYLAHFILFIKSRVNVLTIGEVNTQIWIS